MRKLNYSKIRRSAQADLRKYERLGVKIFTEALKLQAVPNPSPLPMQKAYVDFYQAVFVDSAKKEFNRIRQDNREKAFIPDDFFLNTWREWIKDWVLTNLGTLIVDVTETTTKKVQEILSQAITDGLNPFQIEQLLLESIPDVKRARAIARTESTRAFNEGKKKSAQDWANQTGTNLWKIWIHGGAKEPRFQHIQAQNKPIPANSFFEFTSPKIGIVQMDKPGDINGGAAQTVNCSCVVVYVSEAYARRNFPDAFIGGVAPRPVVPIASQAISIPQSISGFRIANTFDEAKEISKNIINQNTVLKVDSTKFGSNLTLSQLNRYNEQLDKLTKEYRLSPHLSETSQISLEFASSIRSYGFVEHYPHKISKINFGDRYDKTGRTIRRIERNDFGADKYAPKSKVDENNLEISTLTHEFAHVISTENPSIYFKYPEMESFWKEIKSLKTKYKKELKKKYSDRDWVGMEQIFLGDYADTNRNEFMAEAFTEYKLSSNPSKYALEVGRLIDKYFKR